MQSRDIEWPTVLLIAANYLVLGLVVWFHASLPWWVIMPVGAYCVALHGSLQHEALHGHPTRNRVVNDLLVTFAPHLWLPYFRYKKTHLIHHNDENLTDPRLDPESYYLLPEDWAHLGGLRQMLYTANNALAGRMILGPAISIVRFWSSDAERLRDVFQVVGTSDLTEVLIDDRPVPYARELWLPLVWFLLPR